MPSKKTKSPIYKHAELMADQLSDTQAAIEGFSVTLNEPLIETEPFNTHFRSDFIATGELQKPFTEQTLIRKQQDGYTSGIYKMPWKRHRCLVKTDSNWWITPTVFFCMEFSPQKV